MSEPESQVVEVEQDNKPADAVTSSKQTDTAEEDAILDRLMSSNDDVAEPEPVPAKAETPEPTAAPNPDRERAIAALKRDGVPQSIISQTSDEDLLAWGLKAAKRQADVDEFGNKMKELEKKVSKSSDTAKKEDAAEQEDDNDAEPPSDVEESASDANDPLHDVEELLGKDAAKPLRAMADELSKLKQSQQDLVQQAYAVQAESAEFRLRGLYGDKSPTTEQLHAEVARLGSAKPGAFTSVLQMVTEAFSNLTGVSPEEASRAPAKRSNVQPTPAKGVSRAERPVSKADAEDAILEALLDGKPAAEARRLTRK